MLSILLALAANPVCETPHELASELRTLVSEQYVIPAIGEQAAAAITDEWVIENLEAEEFGRELTFHLRDVTGDMHFMFDFFDPDAAEGEEDWEAAWLANAPNTNFGVQRVEVMEGNIGYLRITDFHHVDIAGPTYQSAFQFLSNSAALIIDLRGNPGGEGASVDAVRRYVLGHDDYPRLRFIDRNGVDHSDEWFDDFEPLDLPVRYGTDKPVYVLVDGESFSAAEALSYGLQQDGRAVIIGEATGGGANPPETFDLTCQVRAWLPTKQPVDPRTGTNWESVGVLPDMAGGEDALETALGAARAAMASR